MTRHRGDEISWPCHGEALYIPLLSLSLSFSLIAPNHSISSPFFFLSLSSLPPSLPPPLRLFLHDADEYISLVGSVFIRPNGRI